MWTIASRLILAAVVALAAAMLAAGPAYAHNSLISTSPAADATVPTTPSEVVLTFDEPAVALGTQIVVTGPAGPVQAGAARMVGTAVVQALEPGAPAGRYTVDWRVASADGHPVTGSYTFTATNDAPDSETGPGPEGTSTSMLQIAAVATVVRVAGLIGASAA